MYLEFEFEFNAWVCTTNYYEKVIAMYATELCKLCVSFEVHNFTTSFTIPILCNVVT